MKIHLKKLCFFAIIATTLFAFKPHYLTDVKGWFIAGSERESYEIGTEMDSEREGKVAYLKSIKKVKHKFGTIMQTFSAENYLGKKLKLTGFIKTEEVKDWAGMWMRVDGKSKSSLSFDNMNNRKIKGTTSWNKYEIILDVPKNSSTINYGVLLSETGKVWLDHLTFEIVGDTEATTGKTLLTAPSNSSFED